MKFMFYETLNNMYRIFPAINFALLSHGTVLQKLAMNNCAKLIHGKNRKTLYVERFFYEIMFYNFKNKRLYC